jgi:hypothetical protein
LSSKENQIINSLKVKKPAVARTHPPVSGMVTAAVETMK